MPVPAHESLELLRRFNDGDRAALSDLLDRFGRRLLDRIRLMMGERARAQAESMDFLQATFLAVVERIEKVEIRDDKELLRWMTWIARNSIRDHVRREHEGRMESLSLSIAPSAAANAQEDPLAQVALAEQQLRLAEAIEALPEDARDVVILHSLEGLTFRAVGERLACDEESVRWKHRKALLRLVELIQSSDA